ncbi:MAG: transposase [Gemmatimonadales bacterium]
MPIAVGGIADHVHLLVRLKPVHRLADVVRDVKASSSLWVHVELGIPGFGWQDGYAVFSVDYRGTPVVERYILNQEQHHRVRHYEDEFELLLQTHGLELSIPSRD